MTDLDKEAMQIADNIRNEALEYERIHYSHDGFSVSIKMSDYKKLIASKETYFYIKFNNNYEVSFCDFPLNIIKE